MYSPACYDLLNVLIAFHSKSLTELRGRGVQNLCVIICVTIITRYSCVA